MAYDKKIYLDNASTTPIDAEVLEKMLPYFGSEYGNPSSLHMNGRMAGLAMTQARAEVAHILGAHPEEIIFTGSGTESDNLAILGVARANQAHGNHIIISAIEHKAILESAKQLEHEGFRISILPVDEYGRISVDGCIKLITPETILVSVMYGNNEIGTIEPIQELAHAIHTHRGTNNFPLLHTDACQVAGFLALGILTLGVDMLTLNGSKIYGPKGIGILYKKNTVLIKPIIHGGGQEKGLRAGTENLPLIIGFAEALKKVTENHEIHTQKIIRLREYFINQLIAKIPYIRINGHPNEHLPHIVHVSIPHIEGESMLLMLDQHGIEVGTGSACSTSDLKPSHVLTAIGQSDELMHGSIRFSLGKDTTKEDLDHVLSVFPEIVSKLQSMSALTLRK